MVATLSTGENRQAFLSRLREFTEEEVELMDFAYDLAKEAHRPHMRDSGERFFEHPRAVALIILDECQLRSANGVITSLTHDTLEDTPIFGSIKDPHAVRMKKARFRIGLLFGDEVARAVCALTKPAVSDAGFATKEAATEHYLAGLQEAPEIAMIVKMADRLHNLRSLSGTSRQKQKKTIEETRRIYLPLFSGWVSSQYSSAQDYLVAALRIELERCEQELI